jgi:multimeric flavodoxin WrbA
MDVPMSLSAVALNCTLKPSPSPSSTQLMIDLLATALAARDVHTETVRVADLDVRPGVSADEGDGDEWPMVLERIEAADLLILGTPIWLGAPSSVCKRVCERLDDMLGRTDDRGRMPTMGKVALVAVVGNEDGAHRVSADCYQWLADVGFTIPPSGTAYWVGEAMAKTDFADLDEIPATVRSTVESAASSAAHLVRFLREHPYPGVAPSEG